MRLSDHSHPLEFDASFAEVRAAVGRAREGGATRLEGNVGMTAEQAARYARSLLVDAGPGVELDLDEPWLLVAPRQAA